MLEKLDLDLQGLLSAEQRAVVGLGWLLMGSHSAGEDLYQETCLEVLRHPDRCPRPPEFGRWVYGVARNVARRLQRAARSGRATPLTDEALEILADAWARRPLASQDGQRSSALEACVAQLGTAERELLVLHYEEDHSCAEIGRRTARSEDAVKTALSRLRARLRDCINRRVHRPASHG